MQLYNLLKVRILKKGLGVGIRPTSPPLKT